MRSARSSVNVPAIVLGTLLSVVLAAVVLVDSTSAQRGGGDCSACIAIVRLQDVMAQLNQRAASEADLKEMAARFDEEGQEIGRQLQELEDEIAAVEAKGIIDQQRLDELGQRRHELRIQAESLLGFAGEKMDIEQSLMLQDIYQQVQAAITEIAETDGYDLVVRDASGSTLSFNPNLRQTRVQQINRQIAERLLLYAGPAVDITDQVVTRMNNKFNQAAAAPGAGLP